MREDLLRGAAAGFLAAATAVVIEAAFTAFRLTGGVLSVLAYAGVAVALATLAGIVGALVVAAATGLVHLMVRAVRGRGARWRGLFLPAGSAADRRVAGWVHGAGVAAAVLIAAEAYTVVWLVGRFREPTLIAMVAGMATLGWLAIAGAIGLAVVAVLRDRRLLPARHAELDPLVDARAAAALWSLIGWAVVLAGLVFWPRFQIVFPLRHAAAFTLFALLLLEGRRLASSLARRGRRTLLLAGGGLLAFTAVVAVVVEDADARRAALRSPVLATVVDGVRVATDVDRDGYGFLFGEGDCAPLDGAIHPGARDVPGDGIDQNCAGGDFVPGPQPSPHPTVPVPEDLLVRDGSVLLITVDTLRYDHTGAGGHDRDTTPNLDALAARGAWFERAYSTGSLTKDVLPTLLTSRHMQELPLGPRTQTGGPQFPHRLEDAATTLAEVLRSNGFRTASFAAFSYLDGWNLEQGVEHAVNLPENEPHRMAGRVTDEAIDWLESLPSDERWFLWVHYFEPHYPYVPHEGGPAFGGGEVARYDGEIHFVDRHVGRLLDWLESDEDRASSTMVVVTSDHGEDLGERKDFGHGGGVWPYLVHIPLVIAVPDAEPRRVATPASLIDVAPTLVAFLGVEADESWTGRAHVEAIAFGEDEPDRIVFAAEKHKRMFAAITSGWQLIRDDYRNLYRLVDLDRDPRGERDASDRAGAVFERLRGALIDWRERVRGAEVLQ